MVNSQSTVKSQKYITYLKCLSSEPKEMSKYRFSINQKSKVTVTNLT